MRDPTPVPERVVKEPPPPKPPKPPRERKPPPRSIDPVETPVDGPLHFDEATEDEEMPLMIERMAGLGLTPVQIGLVLAVNWRTIERDYGDVLARGQAKASLKVANALFQTAVDPKHPKHTTAAIFWKKARDGWCEARADEAPQQPGADAAHLTDPEVGERFTATMKALKER